MQKILLFLTILVGSNAFCQNKLFLENKTTGKRYTFHQNNRVEYSIKDSSILFTEREIVELKDTSFLVSSFMYSNDSSSFIYNRRQLETIEYDRLSSLKFPDVQNKKWYPGMGMFISGFMLIISPLAAYDSEANYWNPNTFYSTISISTGALLINYIIFKKLDKKHQHFHMDQYNVSIRK